MSDRELLEAAAKAAGMTLGAWLGAAEAFMFRDAAPGRCYWNPLTDDGDALRLAVKCSIYIQVFTESCDPSVFARSMDKIGTEQVIPLGTDPYAATRRAIVRAAAAMAAG